MTERDRVSWDLSESHTVDDVDWPTDLSALSLDRGPLDTIVFPGGQVWTGREEIQLYREGDLVTNLDIRYQKQSVPAAADLARTLAETWGVPGAERITAWERTAEQAVTAGRFEVIDRLTLGGPTPPVGGPGGPVPSIEIGYSLDEDNPARVRLEFFWEPGPGE